VTTAVLTHQVDGRGEPILLLNGELMTMAAWEPIAAGLMVSRRVVRCDLRGQLLSSGTPPTSLQGHVETIERLLDELAIETVDVVGTSFGALVGLELAATRPDRVRSLIAGQVSARPPAEGWSRDTETIAACRRAAIDSTDGDIVFDRMVASMFSDAYLAEHAELFDLRRRAVAGFPPEYFAGLLGMFDILSSLDFASRLERILAPTVVVESARDRVYPSPASADLARRIPRAEHVLVSGAGHGVVIEDPVALLGVMQSFLSRRF